jgi:hypothetical protein
MVKTLIAVLLACVLAASNTALASNNDSKDGTAAKGAEQKSEGSRGGRSGDQPRREDNLDTCKRDADGMKGPERSRFMTECLKQRR